MVKEYYSRETRTESLTVKPAVKPIAAFSAC